MTFWESIAQDYEGLIREVCFPLPGGRIGSGAPTQPDGHLQEFLRRAPLPRAALVNPIVLAQPVDTVAPAIIDTLKRLHGDYGLSGATVTDLALAMRIRGAVPDLPLTASCLMQIGRPNQVPLLEGVIDTVVPDTRIVRDLPALTALKAAFPGRIRLMVNESCLPGCPFRVQHFYEMGSGFPRPLSLCAEVLEKHPWLRLTGGWVLPQHLHLYQGTYDELKLAGRVTLRDPEKFRAVLKAYVHRLPMLPRDIGGGPASVLEPMEISESFFAKTLECDHQCHTCSLCRDYYARRGAQRECDIDSTAAGGTGAADE
jgi:hypothetical protein